MPQSSEAFNSKVASLNFYPNISQHKARIDEVFPHPGGPVKIIFGIHYYYFSYRSQLTMCSLPTISSNILGLYFSSQISCD